MKPLILSLAAEKCGKEEPKDTEDDVQEPGSTIDPGNIDNPSIPMEDAEIPQHKLEMDDPIIPQTGAVRYPIWLLNGMGSVCIRAGIFLLKKASLEDVDEEDMFDEKA